MPCNSDYMRPTSKEVYLSKVAYLLEELNGKQIPNEDVFNSGCHPRVHSFSDKEEQDNMVRELCERLQDKDIKKYSLEMQIWWRDHQIEDEKRVRLEIERAKNKKEKDKALSKLTEYERKILGIKY